MSRCKRRSVDNSRIFNAFALTARMNNDLLHPGCRCALPWAMFFCAYSACWSIGREVMAGYTKRDLSLDPLTVGR